MYIYNHINLFVYINSGDIEIIQIFHIILPFLKWHRVYIKSLLDFLKMQKKSYSVYYWQWRFFANPYWDVGRQNIVFWVIELHGYLQDWEVYQVSWKIGIMPKFSQLTRHLSFQEGDIVIRSISHHSK